MLALRPAAAKASSLQPQKEAQAQAQAQAQEEKPSHSQSQINNSHTPAATVTTNILPCRIHHDGPVNVSSRHWNPVSDTTTDGESNTSTAYFRGRKLRGRSMPLPDGYQGVVVTKPPQCENSTRRRVGDDDEEEEEEEPISQLETVGTFSTLTVWEHEKLPADEDVYVRSMGEWISFAHAMHGDDEGKAGLIKN
ncbi:RNA exonuclease 4 [Arthroderma uncinatum]|uniref:RNA exonuclease 4 n=1 Tax=Arthroderma uncinatum TaxID=74035 RepID=UPI00144AC176|nr:RNA exonuclease 4 [Arthroderma uncinatum]KAF3483031.1 RNA exonuclease 4 [Arthroderma uncinatum]